MDAKMLHFNTLCCEPVIVRAPNGRIVVLCQCDGKTEPNKENRVYVFTSDDEGNTWSNRNKWHKGKLICPDDGKAVYCTGAYVYNDCITAFITKHNGDFLDWECRLYYSYDNGESWLDGGLNPWFDGLVFLRGCITLSDGAIAIAYQHYPITKEENDKLKQQGHRVMKASISAVECGFIISHDGKSFDVSNPVALNMDTCWAWAEPVLAELSDGSIAMLMRKDGSGFLWDTKTSDRGKTWSVVRKTEIPNPANKPFLIKHDDGRIFLINTPNSNRDERYPLSVFQSIDEMQSWEEVETLSDIPAFWSYSWAIFSKDGKALLIVFEDRHNLYFSRVEI